MRVRRWDIFCRIIDNYGDAGVCWRLARSLAREHGQQVRLWVDALDVLRRLNPAIASESAPQHCDGVEVRQWSAPFPGIEPHDIVVETFGCDLPDTFVAAMAARNPPPVWINLEYLSAEHWVEGCHRLPSPHPRLPLTKYFYFPGFTPRTGGLLIERDLIAERDAFRGDPTAALSLWRTMELPAPARDELRVSLFCYPTAPVNALAEAWARSARPVTCLVPDSVPAPAAGGSLKVQPIPFLPQTDYDRLLWACDLNFVRGEDSFVRAQLAAVPLVWQIYPRQDRAHMIKLKAFLDLYCVRLPADAAAALRNFCEAWNEGALPVDLWPPLLRHLDTLKSHAGQWAGRLTQLNDLAAGLVEFAEERLQYAPFKIPLTKQELS
ncbi:MAG TPA: elongation factor P maturation arginine rhamnosyltransferase EarP [Burkholderiales bacterium]|nr:elongation factor P maturation arginine rhamnosyltransferase EarP [Burkholderiales bacterium]